MGEIASSQGARFLEQAYRPVLGTILAGVGSTPICRSVGASPWDPPPHLREWSLASALPEGWRVGGGWFLLVGHELRVAEGEMGRSVAPG